VITLGIAWWITTTVADDSAPTALANAALTVSTVLLIAAGIVLVLIPRTLRTGAGILIGFIAAMLAAGAVWVLLVLSFVT
jgi:ABC-type xylose transport system permease subunit